MKPIEPDDDVYTLEEWRKACNEGAFIDSDGHGAMATYKFLNLLIPRINSNG